MRSVLIIAHTFRYEVTCMAADAARQLRVAGFDVRMLAGEASEAGCDAEATVVPDDDSAADGAEIVLVFGGDGTFLRAAEYARPAGVPMLGVNFGHVGFLAEADPEAVAATIKAVIDGRYEVEERTTVDVEVSHHGTVLATSWALNEASVEKSKRERVLEVAVAVDERPLLRFGCDGVLCATPTGSTAYAYSVGGPIVWPNVDAISAVVTSARPARKVAITIWSQQMRPLIGIGEKLLLPLCFLISSSALAAAGITRIEISSVESPTFEGRTFGSVGAYEKLRGKAFGELDPDDVRTLGQRKGQHQVAMLASNVWTQLQHKHSTG